MIALKVIRALFPARFQHLYGDEWESMAEDLLAEAGARGTAARAGAWAKLLVDTGRRAPVAHAICWRDSFIGQPPQLAGAGAWGGAIALSKHWVARPARGIFNTMVRYSSIMLWGAIGAVSLHAWLEHRAVTAVVGFYDFSRQAYSDSTWLVMALVAPILLVLLVKHGKQWRREWRRTGFAVASPLLVFCVGMVLTLHAIFFSTLSHLSSEALGSMASYPKRMDMPARPPYASDTSVWTVEQRMWFDIAPATGLEVVKPDRLEQWCSIRMATLDGWRSEIQMKASSMNQVDALLLAGATEVAVGQGCLTAEDAIMRENALAVELQRSDIWQRTWEPFSLLPVMDNVTAARYILQPRMWAEGRDYCEVLTVELSRSTGRAVDVEKMAAFCGQVSHRWASNHESRLPLPEYTAWQRIKWAVGVDRTERYKLRAMHAPRLDVKDLAWMRQEIASNKNSLLLPLN